MKSKLILLSILLLAAFQFSYAQSDKKSRQDKETITTERIKDILESQDFTFQAQRMNPMRGGVRYLSGGYDLRVSKDELRSFLPYFGRVYMMPMTPAEGPLRFDSRDYAYQVKEKGKGTWEVLISPKDVHTVQQLRLTIYDNGNANLSVQTTNRQPISFDGYISA